MSAMDINYAMGTTGKYISLTLAYSTIFNKITKFWSGFELGSEQDCCLWRLQSHCSNHSATTAGLEPVLFEHENCSIFQKEKRKIWSNFRIQGNCFKFFCIMKIFCRKTTKTGNGANEKSCVSFTVVYFNQLLVLHAPKSWLKPFFCRFWTFFVHFKAFSVISWLRSQKNVRFRPALGCA